MTSVGPEFKNKVVRQGVTYDLDYESVFWTQDIVDHVAFIRRKLSCDNKADVDAAKQIEQMPTGTTDQMLDLCNSARAFTAGILTTKLVGKSDYSGTTGILTRLIKKIEYFEFILTGLLRTAHNVHPTHILKIHKMWLGTGVGHCHAILRALDSTEKGMKKWVCKKKKMFRMLLCKAKAYISFTVKTGLSDFPAIGQLNKMAMKKNEWFIIMLEKIKGKIKEKTIISSLTEADLDRMIREHNYYAIAMSNATGQAVNVSQSPVKREA